MGRQVTADSVFFALGDPTRRAIYEQVVSQGTQNVQQLTSTGAISQPAVSKHLKVLKAAGLVKQRKQGRQSLYSPDHIGLSQLEDWIKHYRSFWENHLNQLEELLKKTNE